MSDEAFTVKWQVFEDYIIQGRRLRPILKGPKNDPAITFYAPGVREELPGEIAKLERNDRSAVLEFARRYGVLGFSELSENKVKRPYGDPLDWLWLHAETLALCLSLKEMLDSQATERLSRRLLELAQGNTQGTFPTPVVMFASRGKKEKERRIFFATIGPNRAAVFRRLAANMLCAIVNANITQLHPELAWSTEHEAFRQHFRFTALIEVAYWHLANALQGGRVKRCARPGCRGIFIQTDRRQRFCPKGVKGESQCALLVRQHKFRGRAVRKTYKKGTPSHGTKKRK